MNQLNIARILIITGFLIGLSSLYQTVSHIGNPEFLLIAGDTLNHGYYHFFREACGDIAAMITILYFLFSSPCHRTPTTWLMSFIIATGYYAPYWVGMPFNDALSAPHMRAEIAHVLQAAFVFAGLIISIRTINQEGKDKL